MLSLLYYVDSWNNSKTGADMVSELVVIKESEIRSDQTWVSLSQKRPAVDTLAHKFSVL